jgi:hypothetical protein
MEKIVRPRTHYWWPDASYTEVWFSMRMRQVEEEELTVKLQTAGLLLRQQILSSAFLLRNLSYSVQKKKKG